MGMVWYDNEILKRRGKGSEGGRLGLRRRGKVENKIRYKKKLHMRAHADVYNMICYDMIR